MKAILDTDILSEILRAKNTRVAQNAAEYIDIHGRFTLSVMTVSEMIMGWHKIQEHQRTHALMDFFDRHDVLPVGISEAAIAGRILGDLERFGITIGPTDPFIAATSIVSHFPLITGNTRHFSRVIELGYPLELLNWREIIPHG